MAKTQSGISITGTFKHEKADGTLIVQSQSMEGRSALEQRYEAERIRYCERHRNDDIPMYYRTGERPKNLAREASKLWLKNLARR